jgi:uncharacterized protein YceH (UPF0502 family)
MIELTADEARVLGVLIEKAQTTPDQYPLSLNAIVSGANQKNNRDPVITMTEDAAFDAVESLRGKGLATRVDVPGNRVSKYRHNATETLHVRTSEIAILAELLLRGPQTQGELRGRASRMAPLESLDVVRDMLRALSERPEPLVKQIAPSPGSRAERFVQLLAPEGAAEESIGEEAAASKSPSVSNAASLASRVAALEGEVAALKDAIKKLAASVGEADPLDATISETVPAQS